MVKHVEIFFQIYNKCLVSENFLVLDKSYSISLVFLQCLLKNTSFIHFLRSFLITLSVEKELLFWKKVWKKSWILDPKICMNPGPSNNAGVVQCQTPLAKLWSYLLTWLSFQWQCFLISLGSVTTFREKYGSQIVVIHI